MFISFSEDFDLVSHSLLLTKPQNNTRWVLCQSLNWVSSYLSNNRKQTTFKIVACDFKLLYAGVLIGLPLFLPWLFSLKMSYSAYVGK